MSDVSRILGEVQSDPRAADRLLPLVYEELRKLAAAKLAREQPGESLQATALVHEVYLRPVDQPAQQEFDGRGHFLPRRRRRCAAFWSSGPARKIASSGAASLIVHREVIFADDFRNSL